MTRLLTAAIVLALTGLCAASPGVSQTRQPLHIVITQGVIEPMPFALSPFISGSPATSKYAADIAGVIAADLTGTGLFRAIPAKAQISRVTSFDSPVQFADWKAINAQALITGAVTMAGAGKLMVKFRLFDVFAQAPLGKGLQFIGAADTWRRMAHKVADAVYARITGETGYFDSRVVFVAESGPKNARVKRLALMDYDGANLKYLTDGRTLVLAPRFSPSGNRVLYTSFASGFPRNDLLDLASLRNRALAEQPGTMTFAPRFSPDGRSMVYSVARGGNTDIYRSPVAGGRSTRLTAAPSIETAPCFSPDGRQIVFESDRSGNQQLYIMPARGGDPKRISFGQGSYGTPVWSPRGDYIAFTKKSKGRFYIGVMRIDGSEERLLTASFLDEGPTWAPNGRVIMFARETPGPRGTSSLYTVDISGRNLHRVPLKIGASDPDWSPLLQ